MPFCHLNEFFYTSNLSDNNVEEQLINMTRDNVQLLINDLFSLVRRTDTDGTFVELPLAVMALPRAKPLPDSVIKEKTKWEQFAERKGIKRKVTDRNAMVYDDDHKDYLPRHGAKSAKNQPLADWCEELN